VLHISIWGGLKLCLGGLSPPKPPRGDGTEVTFSATVSRLLPLQLGFERFHYISLS